MTHAPYRSICKFLAVFLGGGTLLLCAAWRLEAVNVLWALAPLLCLWLLDAGYVAADSRLDLAVTEKERSEEDLAIAANPVVQYMQALGSLSTWPFYIVLFGLLFGGTRALPKNVAFGYPSQFPAAVGVQSNRLPTTLPTVRSTAPRPLQTSPNGTVSPMRPAGTPINRPAVTNNQKAPQPSVPAPPETAPVSQPPAQ